MRLQKQRSRQVKGKEYYRWTVVIPPEKVEELEWQEGAELEPEVKKGNLIIKKKEEEREREENAKIP